MLIKQELLTIRPKAPMQSKRKTGKMFYVYADVVDLEKSGIVLAVFIYNKFQELIYRFYCDKKTYIVHADGCWCKKNINDYTGWNYFDSEVDYYKGSKGIITNFLSDFSFGEGLSTIKYYITEYNENRRQRYLRNKQKRIDDKINSVPNIEHLLKPYCDSKIFNSYLFISKKDKKDKRNVTCGVCGGKYQVSGVKHRETGVCKKCGSEGAYYLNTYKGPVDKCRLVVCNNTESGATAFQWFKVEREYRNNKARYTFFGYYYCFEEGDSKIFYKYSYNSRCFKESNFYRNYDKTYVYTDNLSEVLGDTLKNISADIFSSIKRPQYFYDIILNLREYPATEYMLKLKLYSLASCERVLNYDKPRDFAKWFGVSGQYLPIFQKLDVNYRELKFLKQCGCFLKDEYVAKLQKILATASHHNVIGFAQDNGVTIKKTVTYLYNQMQKLNMSGEKCLMLWKAYVGMSKQMNVQLTNKALMFPQNVKKAHDQTADKIKIKETALEKHKFKVAVAKLYKTFVSWHDEEFIVIHPQSRADLVREGQILSHCVGKYDSYYNNHIAGKSLILLIRSVKNTDKPLYTLELDCKKLEIKQFYGKNNKKAPVEAYTFVKKYIKQILKIMNKKEKAA